MGGFSSKELFVAQTLPQLNLNACAWADGRLEAFE